MSALSAFRWSDLTISSNALVHACRGGGSWPVLKRTASIKANGSHARSVPAAFGSPPRKAHGGMAHMALQRTGSMPPACFPLPRGCCSAPASLLIPDDTLPVCAGQTPDLLYWPLAKQYFSSLGEQYRGCVTSKAAHLLRSFHVVCSAAGFLCITVAVVLTYLIVPASVRPRCATPMSASSSARGKFVQIMRCHYGHSSKTYYG